MGFEFLGAAEQFGAASPALVDAFGLGVGVFTRERVFGTGLSQHRKLLRGESLTPFVVAELHMRTRRVAAGHHASTVARGCSAVSHGGSIPRSSRFSALASR